MSRELPKRWKIAGALAAAFLVSPALLPNGLVVGDLIIFMSWGVVPGCGSIHYKPFSPPPPGWSSYPHTGLMIPVWYPAAYVLFLAWSASGKSEAKWRRQHGLCVKCRYDLRGNVSGVCPECGTPIVKEASTVRAGTKPVESTVLDEDADK